MSAAIRLGWLAAALGLSAAVGATGCSTEAFCFNDCPGDASSSSGTGTGSTDGAGGSCFPSCSSSGSGGNGGDGGSGICVPSNNGIEICDHRDNDCNDVVDDIPGINYSALTTCGACDKNCLAELLNNVEITCDPGPNPGTVPGTCSGTCDDGFVDVDGNGSCEYYCPPHPEGPESICDNFDNDCDGQKDEDVQVCTSINDCGTCGNKCVVLHGTPECVHTGAMPCTLANTQCQIETCECPDTQGNCWHDLDGVYATGCEYQCQPTNGGVEICGDGLDNDCDGLIDSADDLSGDPAVGQDCYGDDDGECATPAHQGVTICQGGQVICSGTNVIVENQQPETCNTLDDDCDGQVDEGATDAGGSCGTSNIFPCSLGTYQCQSGALVCVGAVNPAPGETCNGVDDDCDGQTDFDVNDNVPPMDAVGACNTPPPPPVGVPQPCQAGTKACVGGTVVCQGSVLPPSQTDTCGVDSNCDGSLTNQPNLMTDAAHCGSCTTNCYANAVHSNWSCNAGTCQFQGCQPGYYDLDGNNTCEYACVYIQATETCNGVDDNCNGLTDEGVVAPSPVQVCNVSPTATSAQCTTPAVTVACQNGGWRCTFPPNVCNNAGGCASTPEVCDTLDNNCNGLLNENTPNYNKPCNSDDGLAPPGHGACRTQGLYQCSGPNAVTCSALPANCATLPGGCTELCDGVDNDCDGAVDETFNSKGSNATNFVKPVVTRVAPSLWMYAYEASRPSASGTEPGSGNGFHTSAPAGQTIDRTRACSAPGKIPWFNVSSREVEQTCTAMGGAVCSVADWQTACQATVPCTFGFGPRNSGAGTTCTTPATTTKRCNLALTFDFNTSQAGDQDGLLPTASTALGSCWADWSGLHGNVAANNRIFDITGNLREVTRKGSNQYTLMGGAFNSQSEDGSTCGFTFYTVNQDFKLFDTGFRCCFSADPTL